MNNNLRIVYLIPLLASLLLVEPVHAEPLSQGSLGGALSYRIEAPNILKVGENASIFVEVRCGTNASVHQIRALLYGGEISPNPFGTDIILAQNTELHSSESINKTITVKPQKETAVACEIIAWYDWTNLGSPASEVVSSTVFIPVKANTYDELSASENTYRNLTYALTITTIALAAIALVSTLYALKRKPKHIHTYAE